MALDVILLIEIGLGVLAFILIVRFLFTMGREQEDYKPSKEDVKREIDRLKKEINQLKGKIPDEEYGKLMDELMEEYYSERKGK